MGSTLPSRLHPTPMRRGVYPRVGGGTSLECIVTILSEGLSPRGRGNHATLGCPSAPLGSIPAWAGEPTVGDVVPRPYRVYPRVGGGTANCRTSSRKTSGLSPRGRGNRRQDHGYGRRPGSIPAWAGEPPINDNSANPARGLSPRGRGNRFCGRFDPHCARSIPAWAGEPAPMRSWCHPCRVYPRVGGGTPKKMTIHRSRNGLSPRGRGNRHQGLPEGYRHGSIPAWAGEPLTASATSISV